MLLRATPEDDLDLNGVGAPAVHGPASNEYCH
jgi:hypothetical protein